MISRKKSQAALEFLTTYGWAFIIILATIGAMTYFGIIDPTKFIPERCTFGTDFECSDFRLAVVTDTSPSNLNVVDIVLVNALGETIDVDETASIADFPTEKNIGLLVRPDIDDNTATGWFSGTKRYFRSYGNAESGLVGGQKQKVRFTLTYSYEGQGFPHVVEGEVFAIVQEITTSELFST